MPWGHLFVSPQLSNKIFKICVKASIDFSLIYCFAPYQILSGFSTTYAAVNISSSKVVTMFNVTVNSKPRLF